MANTQAQQALSILQGVESRLLNGHFSHKDTLLALTEAMILVAQGVNGTAPASTSLGAFTSIAANQTKPVAIKVD